MKTWRKRAGLPASYEITNPSSVEQALLEEVAELRRAMTSAVVPIRAALDVLDSFGDLPDGMMHPAPWNEHGAEAKLVAAYDALQRLTSATSEASA